MAAAADAHFDRVVAFGKGTIYVKSLRWRRPALGRGLARHRTGWKEIWPGCTVPPPRNRCRCCPGH